MSHQKIVAATFVIVCAVSAFLGWVGGYNFDERSPMVAAWCVFTLFAALVAAAYVADLLASAALDKADWGQA